MVKKDNKERQNLIHSILTSGSGHQENIKVLCEELLDSSLKDDYSYGIAFAWTHLALYSVLNHMHEETQFYLTKASKLCEKSLFLELQVECKNILGIYYKSINDVYAAFSCYLEGIELARGTGQSIAIAKFHNNLAVILLEYEDYSSAKTHLLEALKFTNETTLRRKAAYQKTIYSNLITIAYFENDKEAAQHYLDCYEKIGLDNSKTVKNALCNRILVETLNDNKLEALELSQQFLSKFTLDDVNQFFNECSLIIKILIKGNYQSVAESLLTLLFNGVKKEGREQLQYLKLVIKHNEAFNIIDKQIYIDFYNATEALKTTESFLLIEGIKSNIQMSTLENDKESLSKKQNLLKNAVDIDELTGVYNRHFFSKMISRVEGINELESFACIMIDLDYFKQYNDEYGHIEGDRVLSVIGTCLREYATANIFPFRYGGDEFACLCYGTTQVEIDSYVVKIQEALKKQCVEHVGSQVDPYVTLTIGSYYTVHNDQEKPSYYIDMADKALYQAKAMGRNTYLRLGD